MPRQLPPGTEVFTGRTAELASLDRLLRDKDTSTPVVISAVSGMGGIGKTALAVHWAHQARDSFSDGELYIDMQGFHPSGRPVAPDAALGQFIVALGVAADRVPAPLAERSALFRSLMTDRQMLVLIDNVRDADQVRPLLPGAGSARVLITSRSRLAGLAVRDGAQRISLDVLDLRDSVRLLRRTIGSLAARQPGAVAALAALCGQHPLALRIAAEHVAAHDAGDLTAAVAQLSDPAQRLSGLAVPEDEMSVIRKVFEWSYHALPDSSRRLFRLLAVHDGPDIGRTACAALGDLEVASCDCLLSELCDAHLVDEHAPGRYRVHDLLRLFARERLADDEPAAQSRDAAVRLAAWFLASACAARLALDPHLPPLPTVPAEFTAPPMSFDDDSAALSWCDLERANLTAAALSARDRGLHEIGWKLPTALFPYFDRQRHYGDWIATHESAIAAAQQAGDREAEGKVRCNLGSAYRPMKRFNDAALQYEHALKLFREVGWRLGEAKALGNLATTYDEGGQPARAMALEQSALEIFTELDDSYGAALCLSNLGNVYSSIGQHGQAMDCQRQALRLFRDLDDTRGQARALSGIGMALTRSGRPQEALPMLREAAVAFDGLGDGHMHAETLADLARALVALGRHAEARRNADRAVGIYTDIGEDWEVRNLANLLASTEPGAASTMSP